MLHRARQAVVVYLHDDPDAMACEDRENRRGEVMVNGVQMCDVDTAAPEQVFEFTGGFGVVDHPQHVPRSARGCEVEEPGHLGGRIAAGGPEFQHLVSAGPLGLRRGGYATLHTAPLAQTGRELVDVEYPHDARPPSPQSPAGAGFLTANKRRCASSLFHATQAKTPRGPLRYVLRAVQIIQHRLSQRSTNCLAASARPPVHISEKSSLIMLPISRPDTEQL